MMRAALLYDPSIFGHGKFSRLEVFDWLGFPIRTHTRFIEGLGYGFSPSMTSPGGDGGGGGGQGGGGAAGGGYGGTVAAATESATSSVAASAGGNYNRAPWLFPTSDARDLSKYNSVALPAIGATTTILTFTVPKGRSLLITGIGIEIQQNGANAAGQVYLQDLLPFQLTFQLLLNGVPFPGDWASFNFMPGSVSSPDGVSGLKARETQQVSLTVKNNSIVVAAPTQYIGARLRGYLFSKNYDPQSRGAQ